MATEAQLNNPNADIISAGFNNPSVSYNPNAALQNAGFSNAPAGVPVAQTPTTPAPQISTPTAPAPTTTVNVNAGGTSQTTTPQTTTQTATPGLTMPATGSVVDLLNAAGQDSSFAARQQLAQQYGIQGYTGTAAQNQDLSKKYLDAYNAKKGTTVPDTAAQASSAIDSYFQSNPQAQTTQDPTKQFMDTYASMNPVEANLFQQLSTLASTQTNQQSFTDLFKQESAAQGIPELNLQLADINKIMDGTEDDIRAEITNAGGFATESQVQALVGARNKNLLKQANYLTDVINAKNDYVDHIVSLTQADRQQVNDDLDRKLGITTTLANLADKMQSNAKENYQNIIDSVGWEGLSKTLQGNPTQTAAVEKMFGLAPGELQALAAYKKPLTAAEQLQNENQQLQNQKLKQDLATGPAKSKLQFVAGTANQPGGVFNPDTGVFTPTTGTQDNTMNLALSQQTINDTDALAKNPSLASAVGPNALARIALTSAFGGKSNFIGSVEQLRQGLTLDKLTQAKANGATFGALSDSEQQLLAASATKLGTWAIKDNAGNVTGYNIDESDFKKELDKINNFAKLDYVLKGGDPSSVGVQEMPDGTFWTQNSDGSKTQLK